MDKYSSAAASGDAFWAVQSIQVSMCFNANSTLPFWLYLLIFIPFTNRRFQIKRIRD